MIKKLLCTSLTCLLAALATSLSAQEYPAAAIRIVIPTGPGTAPDLAARIMQPHLQKVLGQPIIIDNRTGASGMVAYEFVAKAPADGNTLALGNPNLGLFHVFTKEMRIDPIRDLPPVTVLAEGTILLGTNTATPFGSYADMVAYARANPAKLNWSVPGLHSLPALFAESIKQKHGIDIVVVPFRGGSTEFRQAILINEIQLATFSEGQAKGDPSKLRILATTGDKRLPDFPSTPTFTELGQPELVGFWLTLNAPRSAPKPVVDKLYAASLSALQQPDVKDLYLKQGLYIVGSTPEQSARKVVSLAAWASDVAKRSGLQPQ